MNKLLFQHLIAQTSDSPMALEITNAKGCYIHTRAGKSYLDFISGIAVSSLGHGHPKIIKALHEQIDRHLHVMVYGEYIQKPQLEFAQLLLDQLPESMEQIYLVNSGTEANEGALKLAKKYTGRSKLVAFNNSYHGDTQGSLSVTGRDIYRDPYLPLLPNVYFGEFNSEAAIDLIDDETAAVILEPVQGEGGIIPAKIEWLASLRKNCNEHGALLIFDEIQSGFGRTGKLFAFEHYGVPPDILCIAKAMGGGMPIGGFVSSKKIFQTFKYDPPLNHVTTFGGHPVSCAAAHANLKELLEGNYFNRAQTIEKIIKSGLKYKGIKEVRGMGAMLGLELESVELTKHVVDYCFDKEILLGWTLHSNQLIRLAPPLIISDEEINFVINTILSALKEY